MSTGDAIAPVPMSPQARAFETGGITFTPNFPSLPRCSDVNGLSHMNVFIAGATCIASQNLSDPLAYLVTVANDNTNEV